MTMKVECHGCGEDCSHAYATWKGDPYHFGCIPTKQKNRRAETDDERYAREQTEIARIHDETTG